jgi:hypothetical protein
VHLAAYSRNVLTIETRSLVLRQALFKIILSNGVKKSSKDNFLGLPSKLRPLLDSSKRLAGKDLFQKADGQGLNAACPCRNTAVKKLAFLSFISAWLPGKAAG